MTKSAGNKARYSNNDNANSKVSDADFVKGSESGRVELEGGCRSNPPSTAMSLHVVTSHPPFCTLHRGKQEAKGRAGERQIKDVNDNMGPPQIPRMIFSRT